MTADALLLLQLSLYFELVPPRRRALVDDVDDDDDEDDDEDDGDDDDVPVRTIFTSRARVAPSRYSHSRLVDWVSGGRLIHSKRYYFI